MRRAALALVCCLAACGENLTPVPEYEGYDGGGTTPLPCVPNLDGRIDADELEAAIGVPASFLVSPAGEERPVDVVGVVDTAGRRVWDWSTPVASDRVATFTAATHGSAWYAGSFPSGQFTASLDAAMTMDGVYRKDDDGLWLLGYASRESDPPEGRTLVVYGQPVAIFRFPLTPGAQWVAVGTVENATVRGLPYAGQDTYEVSVDGAGTLELPSMSFTQALRVRTHLVAQPAVGASVTRHQVSFVFECFGEVARATSRDGETNPDFTQASEVRRLGL